MARGSVFSEDSHCGGSIDSRCSKSFSEGHHARLLRLFFLVCQNCLSSNYAVYLNANDSLSCGVRKADVLR